MERFELGRGIWPILECSLLLLYQSTQPAVANSTSETVLYGLEWKIVVRMQSVLYNPLTDSARALS